MGRQAVITQDQIDEAVRLHDVEGLPWSKAAAAIGIDRKQLSRYVSGERVAYVPYDPYWMESAACAGEDPEYFEYEPSRDEEVEDALARYELAKEVCSGCPVKGNCGSTSDTSDRAWTTRAGLMPLELRRRLKGA